MTYAKDMYAKISDFLSWINPKIMTSLQNEALDNVDNEIAKAEAIM